MSTSEFGYVVATDTTYTATANQPLDAVQARVIVNNVNHLADEFAQVRVTWTAATGIAMPAIAANTYVLTAVYQFPITLRQSGDSYKFRIRIGGSIPGGSTGRILAAISAPGASPPTVAWGAVGDNQFLTATTTSATPAWLAGTSQGPAASSDLIYLPAALMQTQAPNTLDAIGGNITAVEIPMGQLSIYASTTNVSNLTLINGVYLAEYIGT